LLEQAVEESSLRQTNLDSVFANLSIIWLGGLYLLANRTEEACALATRTLKRACTHGERGREAWTLCLLGEIAAQSDSPAFEEAETHYKQALALANELGMRPLQAHSHRALGQIYRQLADGEQARTELRAAIDLYQDMEMSLWLPETEARFADLEGHHDL
jgi:tetratricopeptide (TPR) repeat protein